MKHWYRIVLSSAVVSFVLALGLRSSPIVAGPPAEQSSVIPEPAVYRASYSTTPFRVPPPASPSRLRAPTTTIIVNYLNAGTTDFWGDSCVAWPANAQTAFSFALNIWGGLLNSSVPITVNACYASLAPGLLGHAGARSFMRNFTGAPIANTWYPVALANALSGTDLNGSTVEIEAGFATSSSINWYFGTDGNPGFTQYDFVSVVLHEVGHGLGFLGSMSVSSGQGGWGSSGSPYAYDRFTQNGSGQSLINTALFANPSAALATQLTSGSVYFNGTNASAANGGTPAKLYAPGTWSPGSSYSHLDTIYNGTANALMTYALSNGTAIHDPGPVTLGIFKDLGWTTGATGQTTKLYLPLTLNYYGTTPSGPTPGYWLGSTGASEFYVTTDGAYVKNHAHSISVSGCGSYKITHIISEPISNNHYSFSGYFYADGTFTSSTTATVTDGFSGFPITGCGTISGGPWTRVHTWQNSSQPTMPVRVVGPVTVESLQGINGSYDIVRIK